MGLLAVLEAQFEKWAELSWQCVESRILEKERWKMYDSLHCGIFECRALISHNSFSKLSICGAVANWCEELTQLIPGQSHLSMEKSAAKVNDQLSQKLEPQEVDS